MFCQIKSTLYFAFLVLVTGSLVLSIGCSDASSKRAVQKRDATSGSETSSRRSDKSDRSAIVSRQSNVDVTRPTEVPNANRSTAQLAARTTETPSETSADTTSPYVTQSDTGFNTGQSRPVAKLKSELPKTINWDIPETKVATAENKIAAETVAQEAITDVSNMPDGISDSIPVTVGQTQEPQTEQTVQDTTQKRDDANPFAAIADSLTNPETQEAFVSLPEKDDAIGEGVWEESHSIEHDLLDRLVIKKTDDSHNWRLQRNVPVERKAASVEVSSDQNNPNDTEWQDTVPIPVTVAIPVSEPIPVTEPKPVVETEYAPEVSAKDEPEVSDAEPIIDQAVTPPMTPPTILAPTMTPPNLAPTLMAPTLPNVHTDDSDPFGLGAAAAFEQFDQIVGDAATPPATPQTTTQSPPLQDGFGFDGWDEPPSPFDATEPDKVLTLPQQPVAPAPSPPPVRPAQPQQQPKPSANTATSADDPGAAGTLMPVEQYIVNEAKASPVKLMESVELLYKLNKPSLARRLLRQLTVGALTAEDCQQISKRVNPAILVRISLDEEYQPEGGQIVRQIVEGSQSYFESRSTIESAMQRLLAGTDREKDDATRTILSGGETSIEYLLERLAKSNDKQELSETMTLLNAMGESARRALQESLVTTTPLGMRVARLLTQMGRASDSRFLLPMMFDSRLSDAERREVADMVQTLSRNVPSQESAAATLNTMGGNYFRGKVPFMTDANNNVPLWILREGSELPKFVTLSEADASRYFAEKFARYATCLDSQKPAYRQLWTVAFFDLKGAELGSDNSITLDENLLRAMLKGLSVDDIESALRFAMQQDHPIAARVAAELMGEIGDVEAVIYKRGSQSALVKAVGFSDRRVRFAALRSIIKLNPDRQYPGSSVVTQSLVYFTRATGKKRAVVVCPWLGDATAIANLLEPLGYTSETATMGRQAMQLAIDSADTELMMLDVRTPSSNVEFLVQDMRADNRTHDVPIAVLANGWRISRAERAAYGDNRIDAQTSQNTNDRLTINGMNYSVGGDKSRHFIIGEDEFIVERDMMTKAERAAFGSKMAFAFPRPYDEASAKFVVDNLLRESAVEHVPPQLRLAEAKLSIQWVSDLYKMPNLYHFENIEQIAWDTLWLPELTEDTLPLVELIPTANAQRMLTHIVSTPTFPIETRQAALTAFENNAQTNGVLIRGRQILDLYDMYNASGTETVASQQARSNLLDIVERYANYMQNVNYQK